MSSYGSILTWLLISLQGFAFRVRPVSLLVASAFPAGVFALLSYQQLEAITYIKPMFTTTMKNLNKFDSPSRIKLVRIKYVCPSFTVPFLQRFLLLSHSSSVQIALFLDHSGVLLHRLAGGFVLFLQAARPAD